MSKVWDTFDRVLTGCVCAIVGPSIPTSFRHLPNLDFFLACSRGEQDCESDCGEDVHAVVFRLPEPPLAGQEVLQLGVSPGQVASQFVLRGAFPGTADWPVQDLADGDAAAGESPADDLGMALPVATAFPDDRDSRLPQPAQFRYQSVEVFRSL